MHILIMALLSVALMVASAGIVAGGCSSWGRLETRDPVQRSYLAHMYIYIYIYRGYLSG